MPPTRVSLTLLSLSVLTRELESSLGGTPAGSYRAEPGASYRSATSHAIAATMERRAQRLQAEWDEILTFLAGAALGAAAGYYLARRFGQSRSLRRRLLRWLRLVAPLWMEEKFLAGDLAERLEHIREAFGATEEWDEEAEDEAPSSVRQLEEGVLEALESDPSLARRPIEIAARDSETIELRGRVRTAEEAERAAALARTVPGVHVVLDRLLVEEGAHPASASAVRDEGRR